MSKQVKDALAGALADELSGRVGHAVYAGRRDEGVEPPFSVVVVKRVMEILPRSGRYYAEVRVVHVSEVADSTSAAHDARVESLEVALDAMPNRGVDVERNVYLDGFVIEEVEDAVNREDDVYGDVFVIRAGCGRVKP